MRILHVVSRMDRAGIETWLMHVLRHTDRQRFQMDFLVHREQPGHYDEEIRSLGGKVLFAAPLRHVLRYSRAVQQVLRDNPPYDVVHSHLDYVSGYPLRCAALAGVPVRIAHSHNDLARGFPRLRWTLKMYVRHSRRLIPRWSTLGLSPSTVAGQSLFQTPRWTRPWKILPYGIDLAPFAPAQFAKTCARNSASRTTRLWSGMSGDLPNRRTTRWSFELPSRCEAQQKNSTFFSSVTATCDRPSPQKFAGAA